MPKTIRTTTIISLRWKADNSIEVFVNMGKLYSKYNADKLGVGRFTLDRKDLKAGYENELVHLQKHELT